MELHILTECFVDTLLVKTLSPPKKRYNHQKSCNNVFKTMYEEFANKAALGIIDDDKLISKYFKPFVLLKRHNEQLSIYKHSSNPHYIIKLKKAAEDFILKNAEKCNINLDDYNLPSDLKSLITRTKHAISENDSDLKCLFSDLKKNESSDFYKLSQWIELFKLNPYNMKIELL